MTRWQWLLVLAVPVAAALVSVYLGRDANWDFLNYRWYDPYAYLHGRVGTDLLVAEHATFYNPFLELPFYLAATFLPGIVAGFLVAFAAAAGFIPLFVVSRRALGAPAGMRGFAAPFGIALAGLAGGGVLGQIGIVSWDLALGILTLGAIAVLFHDGQRRCRFPRTWAGEGFFAPGSSLAAPPA